MHHICFCSNRLSFWWSWLSMLIPFMFEKSSYDIKSRSYVIEGTSPSCGRGFPEISCLDFDFEGRLLSSICATESGDTRVFMDACFIPPIVWIFCDILLALLLSWLLSDVRSWIIDLGYSSEGRSSIAVLGPSLFLNGFEILLLLLTLIASLATTVLCHSTYWH